MSGDAGERDCCAESAVASYHAFMSACVVCMAQWCPVVPVVAVTASFVGCLIHHRLHGHLR